ncbi:unnamed protein product [Pedinophyceae sp. YPF-701]|nr:unnamed protein product [Pedinophyceae sp. YPF-701]
MPTLDAEARVAGEIAGSLSSSLSLGTKAGHGARTFDVHATSVDVPHNGNVDVSGGNGSGRRRRKIIIDTDPGIDDTMAILAAFNSPDVEVIGLTTVFGNVVTSTATHNACLLRTMAGRRDVPVAEGAHGPLSGASVSLVADFVHGKDGLGNRNLDGEIDKLFPDAGPPDGRTAAQFLVDMALKYPGEVTILALSPLTNLALAMLLDKRFAQCVGEVVLLGGAYACLGNVNPAAEANIFGDPDAADAVFRGFPRIRAVGLDVTLKCSMTREELADLHGRGEGVGTLVNDIAQFYLDYHVYSVGEHKVFLHDPTALMAVLHPEWFKWTNGGVIVVRDGPCRGKTIMDTGERVFKFPTEWDARPKAQIAVGVDTERVRAKVRELLVGGDVAVLQSQ